MKAWTVVAYAYDAAIHCVRCTEYKFSKDLLEQGKAVDSEGNPVHAIFASDEDWQEESCDDCFELISETL